MEDPYRNTKYNCLHNNFGITNQDVLDNVENTFATMRSVELDRLPNKVQFDLEQLKDIHKHIFKDTYNSAGQLRTVNIHKGNTNFLPHTLIEQVSQHLFTKLAKEKSLQNLDVDRFCERAGYYFGEINHIHPFREDNGRTQRTFINQLARHNNYYITWENVTAKQMIEASISAETDNHQLLSQIIKDNIVDKDYQKATRQYAQNAGNIQLAQTGHEYNGQILGITERYVVQQLAGEANQIIVHNRQNLSNDVKIDNHEVKIRYPHSKIGLVSNMVKTNNKMVKNLSNELDDYEKL